MMKDKENLISIGEMAKLTGAGVQALRHYEKLSLLKPIYIHPNSGYRYYSVQQVYLVAIIMLCVELDIPLKDLPKFTIDDTMDFARFLKTGKEVAHKKIKNLNRGLRIIENMEKKVQLADDKMKGDIWTETIPERYLKIFSCGRKFKEIDTLAIYREFADFLNASDDHDLSEYGFMYIHNDSLKMYYAFVEIDALEADKSTLVIPASVYYCKQSEYSRIESVIDVFKPLLVENDSFIAFETDILKSRYSISNPYKEIKFFRPEKEITI